MLQPSDSDEGPQLDRAVWHKPLVSIIITHYNYSEFVRDAILSVLDQTHENWELVVVDDASSPEHRARLETILSEVGDDRVRYLPLAENVGQIMAFFAGVGATSGEFVCLLDPDDRYAEVFLEEALATHLNEFVFCPVVSADQYLMDARGLLTSVLTDKRLGALKRMGSVFNIGNQWPQVLYIPADVAGTHWSSTSSLMFRRSALTRLKPHGPLEHKNGADSYLASGAHVLGGTLFLTKPLVYRMLHENNNWIRQDVFASSQSKKREDAVLSIGAHWRALVDVLNHNGEPGAATLIQSYYSSLMNKSGKDRRVLAKWKRSIMKRLPFKAH